MVGFLSWIVRSLGFIVREEDYCFVCGVLTLKVLPLACYVRFFSFLYPLLNIFSPGLAFFAIEHAMRDPVDGDWEGFPGQLAESIKGTRSTTVTIRF
jgi:hypothetical protein